MSKSIEQLNLLTLNELKDYKKYCSEEYKRLQNLNKNNKDYSKKAFYLRLLFGQLAEYQKVSIQIAIKQQASAIQPRQPPN